MIKYRAPDADPPLPVVDQWLAEVSVHAKSYLPLMVGMVAIFVAIWLLARMDRKGSETRRQTGPRNRSDGVTVAE